MVLKATILNDNTNFLQVNYSLPATFRNGYTSYELFYTYYERPKIQCFSEYLHTILWFLQTHLTLRNPLHYSLYKI